MGRNKTARFIDQWVQLPSCESGERLYHYTSAEGVFGIMEHNEFMATKSNFLNDKMEFLYSLEIFDKLINKYIVNEKLRQRFSEKVRIEMDKIAIIVPSCSERVCTEKENLDFYVVSFSKQENSALNWAEFTEFKGYCMGFDYENLVEGFSERAFIHGTVIYNEEEQNHCLLEELLSSLDKAKSLGYKELDDFFAENGHISEEALAEIAEDMALICSVYAMFFKKSFFAGEQEYRFIFAPLEGENTGNPIFRIRDQVFIPYIMAKFGKGDCTVPLQSVTVGAKNNSDIAIRGIEFYLQGKGLKVPVVFSDIPLRY